MKKVYLHPCHGNGFEAKRIRFVVSIAIILSLSFFVDGKEEQNRPNSFRKHITKKNTLNHKRIERQTAFSSPYQTYHYDQDVNIGNYVIYKRSNLYKKYFDVNIYNK